ncbi:MAG: tryptophan--tRNA ligase [Acidobacteriaceae bacterium]
MSNTPIFGRKRVLSGMRPTGKIHLGNYMGALHNWVRLQNTNEYECYFFIADWHALTTDYADPSQIKQNTVDVALDYLAAGLDPERSVLFVQSDAKSHAELHLLLSMITSIGWLERVPSYKEQQENLQDKDLSTYGFLGYPLLQSADILIYQPHFVPVGQDQAAHVELTREVARRFNFLYPKDPTVRAAPIVGATREQIRREGKEEQYLAEHPGAPPTAGLNFRRGISSEQLWSPESCTLPEPQVLLTPSPKLPGTDGRKMSKSYGNTIMLSDPEPDVRKKLKTMVTDPARVRRTDPGSPDKCPVGDLHKVFSSAETLAKVYQGCTTAGIGCIECKGWVADAIVEHLAPIQQRRVHFEQNPALVKEIFSAGAQRATARAEQTMHEVRSAMGLTSVFMSGATQ